MHKTIVTLAFFIVLLLSDGVRADSGEQAGNGLYATAEASMLYMQMPSYAPFWLRALPNQGARRLPSLLGDHLAAPVFSLSVGKPLDHDLFLEARTEYAHAELHVADSFVADGSSGFNRIGFFSIDPDRMAPWGTPGTAFHNLDFSYRRQTFSLLAGRTYVHGSTHITPFIGPWHMQLHQAYHLNHETSGGTRMTLDDEVRTAYYGLLAGVRLTGDAGFGELSLEGTVAPAFARSWYDAAQDIPTSAVTRNLTIRERHDSPAVKANVRLSLDVPVATDWSLGFTVGCEYLSYMPEVVPSGANNVEHYDDAAHLEDFSSLAGSLGLTLSYEF